MAESGDRELDRLIARFRRNLLRSSLRAVASTEGARARCDELSARFAAYLLRHGIVARTLWGEPDDFGYHDRPCPGLSAHCVTALERGEATIAVDWTAAQYGYRAFPMVLRREAVGWLRLAPAPARRPRSRSRRDPSEPHGPSTAWGRSETASRRDWE